MLRGRLGDEKDGEHPSPRVRYKIKLCQKKCFLIVDKSTIQYIVEEAVELGIEDIIIVKAKGKRVIEDHFNCSFKLERSILEKGKI